MKKAILFLNLGGPEKLSDVRSFLFKLFEDPEVIRIPFTPLRKFVAWMISTLREKTSQSMYAKIGGGSPIRRLTEDQARTVEILLKDAGRDAQVRTAFTCSSPLVEDVIRELAADGVTDFLNFPLYPQYSKTTTKGAYARVRHVISRNCPQKRLFELASFPSHPLFLEAHGELIREAMKNFSRPQEDHIHLVFSAHSIPQKLIEEGDPYQQEMNETVEGLIRILKWKGSWSLGWQSKLGPVKWIGPSTQAVLEDLGRRGVKQVLVDPIAFVTDHIETLYELDQLLKDVALRAGILEYHRVPGLNTHPTFMRCLADLCLSKTEFWTTK